MYKFTSKWCTSTCNLYIYISKTKGKNKVQHGFSSWGQDKTCTFYCKISQYTALHFELSNCTCEIGYFSDSLT